MGEEEGWVTLRGEDQVEEDSVAEVSDKQKRCHQKTCSGSSSTEVEGEGLEDQWEEEVDSEVWVDRLEAEEGSSSMDREGSGCNREVGDQEEVELKRTNNLRRPLRHYYNSLLYCCSSSSASSLSCRECCLDRVRLRYQNLVSIERVDSP